jgi:hypothetical protein
MRHALGVILLLVVGSAQASVIIVDQIGDADGFGIGATNGAAFDWGSIGAGDGDGTDVWRTQDYTYTHVYDISGLGVVTAASLELFTGGQGWYGLTSIYIDDQLVGQLTDGDDVGPGYNYAWLDTFDLSSYATLMDGANTITVDVFNPGGDGWVLDYSKLTITAVPVPAAVWLFGSGLGLLGWFRRRQSA